jgi:hypothetical protein
MNRMTAASLALAAFICSPAYAQDDEKTFSVNWENDIFAGSDDNYTNGVRFSVVSAENDVPNWIENAAESMPFFADEGKKRWEFAFGQNMYTPSDYSIRAPQPNDRPYAGWLYGTVGITSDTGKTLDNYRLTLGVVGPLSGAEQVQETVHDAIGSDHPQGWQNQLDNEPGLNLSYQRKWRNIFQLNPDGYGIDLTPSVGASVGNVLTAASVGAVVRFGEDLPADYGPPLIGSTVAGTDYFTPSEDLGWYVFGGLEGSAVAHNIFLDGNTFSDSASVDKKPFIGGAQVGAAITFDGIRLAYTHIFRSEEFEGQIGGDSYGAFTLSTKF